MKKNLTIYCIEYGDKPKAFIVLADNNIPFTFNGLYTDVDNSVMFEKYILVSLIPELKKICKDTGKTAILNSNHKDADIREITRAVIGYNVIWKNCSLKNWKLFMTGVTEYSIINEALIEIDHPFDLKDSMLVRMIKDGWKSFNVRQKEIKKSITEYQKKRKKNGK
jgi:hypothetical protein